jgi:hypothetical protein
MTNPRQTFKSAKCQAVLAKIVDTLVQRGGASTWDLALVTGLNSNTIGEYLRHMQKVGTAFCSEPAVKFRGGSTYAQWAPGKAALDPDDTVEDMPRKVVVVQQWEPFHRRSQMDCLLFGVPVMGAAA